MDITTRAVSRVDEGCALRPAAPRTGPELIAAAEALVPTLREYAAEIDKNRMIPTEIYRQLEEAGFFHILKPRKYAGFELGVYEHAMVVLTLARGCASTAWVCSILAGDNMLALQYPEEAQDDMWGKNTYGTLAGNTNLNHNAKVEKVRGGYRLSGRWGFCSGSDFAAWLIFNAPVGDSHEGHMFLVPRDEAVTIDDWRPTGLRGTGSRSMEVTDVFVPEHRVMPSAQILQFNPERAALHPTFDAMYSRASDFVFSGVGVGAALGAAEYFAETSYTATRVRDFYGGSSRLAEQEYVACEFADASGKIEMAALLIERRSREAAEESKQRVASSDKYFGPKHRPTLTQELNAERAAAQRERDSALVTRLALNEVTRIHTLVGSKAGFPQHLVSRAKRDAEMVAAHVTLNWRRAAIRYLASLGPEIAQRQSAEGQS